MKATQNTQNSDSAKKSAAASSSNQVDALQRNTSAGAQAAVDGMAERLSAMQTTSERSIKENQQKFEAYVGTDQRAENSDRKEVNHAAENLLGFAQDLEAHMAERRDAVTELTSQLREVRADLQLQQVQEQNAAPASAQQAVTADQSAQWRDFAKLCDQVDSALQSLRNRDDQHLQDAFRSVQRAAVDPTALAAQLDDAAERMGDLRVSLARDVSALTTFMDRQVSAIQNRLPDEAVNRWREQLGVSKLGDEAIRRIRDEALRFEDKTNPAAREVIKGQLMEELAINNELIGCITQELTEGLRAKGSQADVHFFSGDELRDQANGKVTDGLFAWRDQKDQWHPLLALEAKAGERSAQGLERKSSAPSAEFLAEERKYQADLLRDGEARARLIRTEAGQLTATNERVASGNNYLYAAGRPIQLADDGQRLSVSGLVPADSRYAHRDAAAQQEDRSRRQTYEAAEVTAAQLNEMARQFQDLVVQEEQARVAAKDERDREERDEQRRRAEAAERDAE